jgi:hypothetical protein
MPHGFLILTAKRIAGRGAECERSEPGQEDPYTAGVLVLGVGPGMDASLGASDRPNPAGGHAREGHGEADRRGPDRQGRRRTQLPRGRPLSQHHAERRGSPWENAPTPAVRSGRKIEFRCVGSCPYQVVLRAGEPPQGASGRPHMPRSGWLASASLTRPPISRHGDDGLAARVPLLHVAQALGRIGQGVRPVDDRRELTVLDEPGHREQFFPVLPGRERA